MAAIEVKNKRVLVVGLGASGLAAARFLRGKGAKVTVSDSRPATLVTELTTLLDEGFMVETGGHGLLTFRRQDLIVVSPGVPLTVPELKQVRALGAHIIGELELGAEWLEGEVVAVTGSNGKTTTTTLMGEILKAAGRPTLVGGNIGRPVTAMVAESLALGGGGAGGAEKQILSEDDSKNGNDNGKGNDKGNDKGNGKGNDKGKVNDLRGGPSAAPQDEGEETQAVGEKAVWNVLEVSSFQLETIETFRPRIALVLNITPDHLDRHGSFAAYWAAKARITENQGPEDFLVLNAEDVETQKIAARSGAQIFWFSAKRQIKQGAFAYGESVFFRAREGATAEPVMPLKEIGLPGRHNVENVLAAVCAARLAGVSSEVIREAVKSFKAVEHRLEFVRELDGVRYYNDSKATNVDATVKALESFAGGLWLILGGKDKDSDYTVLAELVRERVKTVITIGSAAEKIERQLAGVVKIESAGTMAGAVAYARAHATAGDTVLLAPACASFDQFKNYEERGRVFKELVEGLGIRG